MDKYINFNDKLSDICDEAENETIKLLEERNLDRLALTDEESVKPYDLRDDRHYHLDYVYVTDVRIITGRNGEKYMQFLLENSNEWEFYSEAENQTIAIQIYESVYQNLI